MSHALGLTLLEFATGRHLYDPGHLRIEDVEARLSSEEREQALAASVASMVTELPPFAEDAIWCAMAYRSEDVERAAEGLPVPLRDILHTLLRRNPTDRFTTASRAGNRHARAAGAAGTLLRRRCGEGKFSGHS